MLRRELQRVEHADDLEGEVADLLGRDVDRRALDLAGLSGNRVNFGTLGGLGIGTKGLNFSILNSAGETRALINALASSGRYKLLVSCKPL